MAAPQKLRREGLATRCQVAGDEFGKRGPEASATDVFGTVPKEPVKAAEPVPLVPVVPVVPMRTSPVPATNASSGGFTQLLRALNYEAVKEAPAPPPVESKVESPAAAGGPMSQLLRTIGGPSVEVDVADKPVAVASSSQVTSFQPQSAPVVPAVPAPISPVAVAPVSPVAVAPVSPVAVAPVSPVAVAPVSPVAVAPISPVAVAPISPVAVAPPAPAGGSFTQLFQKLEAEPGEEAAPKKLVDAAPSFTQLFAAPAIAAPAEVPAPTVIASTPGSFTQMFQALDSPAGGSTKPTAVGTRPEMPEASPTQVAIEATDIPGVAVSASAPGSFTQIFQALGAPGNDAVRHEAVPVKAGPAVVSAGSFTQMFHALGTPAAEEARYAPPPAVETSRQAAPSSFTQMFRTLGEEPQQAKAAEAAPESFTRMFGGHETSSTPPSAPAVPLPPGSYERPLAETVSDGKDSGASQMFGTYREPQAPMERALEFSPVEAAPVGRSPGGPTPPSGGLTQLLRTLDQPTQAPKPYTPSYAPPVVSAPQPGSFTGVYGELGTAPAVPVASTIVAPAANDVAAPSEFTRLIQASAVREATLRGGGEAVAAPAARASAPNGGGAGFSMPVGLPAVPHASFSAPAAPQASITGPGGAHASVSAAGGGQASFAAPRLPSTPSASQVKMPDVSKAAGAPAGIQKYVPLLLILVIFLLLAILVAVVVLMKK